ncbi:hypothetical protein BDZ89DRAFT_1149930 [Hymenopellis radicata]|nr:hypothetical protein BDZ89DRAFT_1149930 [Hymenopellis radicata]
MPHFSFDGVPIPFKREEVYVGITFNATERNVFAKHYKNKAHVAQSCGFGGLFALELHVGRGNIPPGTAVQLYTTLVDCHLIHGADISPDVDDAALSLLEAIQVSTLRRILGLGTRSACSVHRVGTPAIAVPASCSLLIILEIPRHAHLALQVSEDLYNEHCSSWFGDLDRVITSFATSSHPVRALPLLETMTPNSIDYLIRTIKASQADTLDKKIAGSVSLYLLHGRLEPQEDVPSVHITTILRHPLRRVQIAKHRYALTKLLLDQHALHGVHSDNSHAPLALQQCRMCHAHLETPEHMLLQCTADQDTVTIRQEFMDRLATLGRPRFCPSRFTDGAALYWLRSLIFSWDSIQIVLTTTARLTRITECPSARFGQ